jgi:hypothetical protein
MSKIQYFLEQSGHSYCYPWAIENFGHYFEATSPWLKKNDTYSLYSQLTNRVLSSSDLSLLSKEIESNSNPSDYNSEYIATFSDRYQCLYISGKVDLMGDKINNLIRLHNFIIIHEPFNLLFPDSDSVKTDFSKLFPKSDLLLSQKQIINQLDLSAKRKKIGLHIRRGDYEIWQNGIYFYDDDFWLKKVNEFISKGFSIFVFTNETNILFHAKLRELGAFLSNESFEIDFVRMILMDEIYGPPSTFSLMAVSIARTCFGYDSKLNYFPPKNI